MTIAIPRFDQALSRLGRAARAYAVELGWPVFPVAARDKIPLLSRSAGGHGHLDATLDLDQIGQWWSEDPDANVGVVCGKRSGIFVVDVDPRHSGDASLRDLERALGSLPHTPCSLTGGGGQQHFFLFEGGLRNSAGVLGSGLDVRAEGGYVVVPPSIHPSGRAYAWSAQHHPRDVPPADAPEWLLDRLRRPSGTDTSRPWTSRSWANQQTILPKRYVAAALLKAADRVAYAPEGCRNYTLNRECFIVCRLACDGALAPQEIADTFARAALASGLEPRAVQATIASALRAAGVAP